MINKFIVDTLAPLSIPVSYMKYSGTASTYITFFYYYISNQDFSDDEVTSRAFNVQLNLYYSGDIETIKDQIEGIFVPENGFKNFDMRDIGIDDATGKYWTAVSFQYIKNLL